MVARLFLLPIILLWVGCVQCLDFGELDKSYRFSNRTSFDVEITIFDRHGREIPPTGSIRAGDSVNFGGRSGGFLARTNFVSDSTLSATIRFQSEPARCRTFQGPIKDTLEDPRARQAYYFETIVQIVFPIDDEDFEEAVVCP
jgi:hypothetical protein